MCYSRETINKSDMNTNEGLKREIGVWGQSSNIINSVIGAGIFVLPAIVAGSLGSASIIAYVFCGLLITAVMLCFAEMGSKVTQTGGAYTYIETSFGRYFGFLTTNLFIFGATIMACAAIANALADTLSYLIPVFENKLVRSGFFLLIFSGFAFVNIIGVKRGITLVKITTIAKLAPLILLVIFGCTKVSPENLRWESIPSLSSVGQISIILFFAFQGAENSLSISGEIKNPRKTTPRAILISFTIILFLYMAIQLISQGVLGSSLAGFKEAPLAEVAKRVMGPAGVTLMITGAAVSMFGYLSGDALNMPRVLFGAARDRVIPVSILAAVHKKYATPYASIILFTSFGCFFAIVGEFKQLAVLSSASILLIYMGVALASIKARFKKENDSDTFKIPGGYIIPVISVFIIIWFLSNLKKNEIIGIISFIGILSLVYLGLNFAVIRERFRIKNL
jgi:APA family basic amino acid/polyamine antiporter